MLFLDRYGGLINLSKSGQLAMRQVLEQHLKRVEWDEWKFPVGLYPFVSPDGASSEKPIAIDPAIAFGRPVVVRAGVSTAAVADRVDAAARSKTTACSLIRPSSSRIGISASNFPRFSRKPASPSDVMPTCFRQTVPMSSG